MTRDDDVLEQRPRYALFDLDFSLIVAEPELKKGHTSRAHLTEVQIEGLPFKHYAINQEMMAQIFNALHADGVIIGLITAGACYKADVMRKFFERIYDMPQNSLYNSPFIGAFDFGDQSVKRAVKITAALRTRLFPINADITLIDDDVMNVHSVRELGYYAIIVHGYPNLDNCIGEKTAINHYYLQEIIEVFGLELMPPESLISTERSMFTPLLRSRQNLYKQLENEQKQLECIETMKCLIRCIPCCFCI